MLADAGAMAADALAAGSRTPQMSQPPPDAQSVLGLGSIAYRSEFFQTNSDDSIAETHPLHQMHHAHHGRHVTLTDHGLQYTGANSNDADLNDADLAAPRWR